MNIHTCTHVNMYICTHVHMHMHTCTHTCVIGQRVMMFPFSFLLFSKNSMGWVGRHVSNGVRERKGGREREGEKEGGVVENARRCVCVCVSVCVSMCEY